jgi:hypothetical protein
MTDPCHNQPAPPDPLANRGAESIAQRAVTEKCSFHANGSVRTMHGAKRKRPRIVEKMATAAPSQRGSVTAQKRGAFPLVENAPHLIAKRKS